MNHFRALTLDQAFSKPTHRCHGDSCRKSYGRHLAKARKVLSSYPPIRNANQAANDVLMLAADLDLAGSNGQ